MFLRRTTKYKAKRTEVDGIKFASKKEANRYLQLKLMEKAGEISNLRLQVPYILIDKSDFGRAIKYICDFAYSQNGIEITEDVKGYKTDVYKIKKRLLAERYGIIIKEV